MEERALMTMMEKRDKYEVEIVKNCLFEEESEIMSYIRKKPEYSLFYDRLQQNLTTTFHISTKIDQPERKYWV